MQEKKRVGEIMIHHQIWGVPTLPDFYSEILYIIKLYDV